MKWWEKTVEYSFVLQASNEGVFNLFAPLDGDVETIGDTVVCRDSTYFILEFKKSLSDLRSEHKKYVNGIIGFLSADEELKDMPAYQAHFLIGGKFDESSQMLSLEIRQYFSKNNIVGGLGQIFQQGVSLTEMQNYAEKLSKLKVTDKDGEESSSGGNVYKSVLAISNSSKTATLIPLHYFKGFQLTPSFKRSRTRGFGM
ncbi:hypothetical protein MDT46_004195 [Vibrio vulnificus]|uniref:hypothetical protein n=1 Tax=Vibrio diabolicus TaxID=50719 RepID=UPI001DC28550|nr:hypothetical protein [Vibrio vulnificus]EIX4880739.1 hypothetical protein [Vibrio vulnificus]